MTIPHVTNLLKTIFLIIFIVASQQLLVLWPLVSKDLTIHQASLFTSFHHFINIAIKYKIVNSSLYSFSFERHSKKHHPINLWDLNSLQYVAKVSKLASTSSSVTLCNTCLNPFISIWQWSWWTPLLPAQSRLHVACTKQSNKWERACDELLIKLKPWFTSLLAFCEITMIYSGPRAIRL